MLILMENLLWLRLGNFWKNWVNCILKSGHTVNKQSRIAIKWPMHKHFATIRENVLQYHSQIGRLADVQRNIDIGR